MKIYIPTRSRVHAQLTRYRLGERVCAAFDAVLVCPPGERHAFPSIACKAVGIAATRQWIIDYHHRTSVDPVLLMLDDDLSIWRQRSGRNSPPIPYTKATEPQILDGLKLFGKTMKSFAHGSIGHALMCHLSPEFSHNGRMLRALAYNVDRMPDNAKFRLPVMEDFDMALQLLTRGHDSVTANLLVQDQSNNNSEGGCSTYRTPGVQKYAALQLQRLWPAYVKVVERAPKREWKGQFEGAPRTDVRINWKKAAKAGGCKYAR